MEKSEAEELYIDKNNPDTVKRLCELCPGVGVYVCHGFEKNSLDTVKRLCDLCPRVSVDVRLSGRGGGKCSGITFSPHTDSINMNFVHLYAGQVSRLHQLVSLAKSWTVRDELWLFDFGPEDWTELSRLLETLDSVMKVWINGCSAPPSVSPLETLWNKTQERLEDDDNYYYKRNKEDFSKIVMKHFK